MDNGWTVFGLLHDEYHGFDVNNCDAQPYKHGLCQMFAVTAAVSHDSGDSWDHIRLPPNHLVAAVPHQYVGDNSTLWFGWGDTGGIVQSPVDHYFYTTAHNRATIGQQHNGTCLLRTNDLSDPATWRGWNGTHFAVTFIDPYSVGPDSVAGDISAHICRVLEDPTTPRRGLPRGADHQPTVNQGLVWSIPQQAFVAVLWNTRRDPTIAGGAPFAVAISRNLIDWSDPLPLPLPESLPDGQLAYPSFLDPDAQHRGDTSFDTIDSTPSLYFGLANPPGTGLRNHWDALVKVPLQWV
jgi:hypothetical protein